MKDKEKTKCCLLKVDPGVRETWEEIQQTLQLLATRNDCSNLATKEDVVSLRLHLREVFIKTDNLLLSLEGKN